MKSQEYFWYASYGSNLSKERFLCYIQGGKPKGSTKTYQGCRNKNSPIDEEEAFITSELYFAKNSKTWNEGGVAFISNNFNVKEKTLAKIYLITKEQFTDVVIQENNFPKDTIIDFDKTIQKGSLVISEKGFYNKIIFLGYQNEKPMLTFTNSVDILPSNKPDKSYLKIILNGITEAHNISKEEAIEYLMFKKGIKDNFSIEELLEL